MTNPLASSLATMKTQVTPAGVALQEVVARRPDDISRKLRRAEEIKSMATDKTSTTEARGLDRTAMDLSRGASLLQVAEQGLDVVSSSLRRIQVLISRAGDPGTSDVERSRLQGELETTRHEITRVVQQTQINGLKPLDGSLGTMSFQTSSSGEKLVVPALPNLLIVDAETTATSLGTTAAGAAHAAATTFDYPPPTVAGAVANNIRVTAGTMATAQSVTVRGREFDLGTFAPDAKSLAAAINALDVDGGTLEAHADPNVVVGVSMELGERRSKKTAARATPVVGTFTINGAVISVNLAEASSELDARAAALRAINASAKQTGVVATDNGRGITLTAEDGRNITVGFRSDTEDLAASSFGVGITRPEGQGSTIDLRYTRSRGFASGAVVFSASSGLDSKSLTMTVVPPTKPTAEPVPANALVEPAPAAIPRPSVGRGLAGIDLSDTRSLAAAGKLVDSMLNMVTAARTLVGDLGERLMDSIDEDVEVRVADASLAQLRYDSAARAVEGALRVRELISREWSLGLAAQANVSRSDVLRALVG